MAITIPQTDTNLTVDMRAGILNATLSIKAIKERLAGSMNLFSYQSIQSAHSLSKNSRKLVEAIMLDASKDDVVSLAKQVLVDAVDYDVARSKAKTFEAALASDDAAWTHWYSNMVDTVPGDAFYSVYASYAAERVYPDNGKEIRHNPVWPSPHEANQAMSERKA